MTSSSPLLPEGITVLERGWLSANNTVLHGANQDDGAWIVDTGYCTHAPQTLELLTHTLAGAPLAGIINTHLHSDHCGGNAALQAHFPHTALLIPPGHATAVCAWDEAALTYAATGQQCPRFTPTGTLTPGTEQRLGRHTWQIHAAPGHDPHAVLLFQPQHRVLISGDALWENGFGVVFPELEGESAYAEVGATLDVIEQLAPLTVIPGHGAVFSGESTVKEAMTRARSRLAQFTQAPERHTRYGLKVLLKFKLLEWQSVSWSNMLHWASQTPYLTDLHQRHGSGQPFNEWLQALTEELAAAGALERDASGYLHNR